LRNRYFLMRHGQSKANVAGIIVSSLARDASGDYGLSALGREQALKSAAGSGLPAGTVICASPFARARQTAEIVREFAGAAPVTVADALCERFFGDWDGTDSAHYEKVWADDQEGRAASGVEPVTEVLDRTTALVAELDRRHENEDILLVSHGDALQILQTGFLGTDPALHRTVPHLETAEIRNPRR
jgi:probable phosphoglycerate mutase